jgi:hypothetical protein
VNQRKSVKKERESGESEAGLRRVHFAVAHAPYGSADPRTKKGHGTPILRCAMTSILIRSRPCCSALPVIVVSASLTDGLKPKRAIVGPFLSLK